MCVILIWSNYDKINVRLIEYNMNDNIYMLNTSACNC